VRTETSVNDFRQGTVGVAPTRPARSIWHPASAANNLLVLTAAARRYEYPRRVWDRFWRTMNRRWDGAVTQRVYGRWAVANVGYISPAFARQYPEYNRCLVDVTRAMAALRGRSVVVVDVGAAIGDTLMLLFQRCPYAVSAAVGIDGDEEFFDYLSTNFRGRDQVECLQAVLGCEERTERGLVRTHSGTASAIGDHLVSATTLDNLAEHSATIASVDVLKVDTDGFDGEVVAGATKLLLGATRAVVFEWSPTQCERADTKPLRAFEVLASLGYEQFVWYRSTGPRVPDDSAPRWSELPALSETLRRQPGDEHYDVVALPSAVSVDDYLDFLDS